MQALTVVYWLLGAYFTVLAARAWGDAGNPRRATTGLFWAILAVLLFAAEHLPAIAVGVLVVVVVLIAGFGGLRMGTYATASDAARAADATRLGHRLFLPALLIPAVTLAGTLGLKSFTVGTAPLIAPAHLTLVSLAAGCVVALAVACMLVRQSPLAAVEQSRRLVDAIGWAALLPLLLATLGTVFEQAGVGQPIAALVQWAIPADNAFLVVVAYALGMALFTIIMGNAFAAFPVMTAGIGLPLLVQGHGADAASLAAIGMLSGYCGTLMTPMAANFNLVPAALLELKDPYGVIRAQWKTGAALLACNIVLMYFIVFR